MVFIFYSEGGIRKAALSNVPVARCNRRGFFHRKSESTFPHQQKALKSHDFKAFCLPVVPTFVPTSVSASELRKQKTQELDTLCTISKNQAAYETTDAYVGCLTCKSNLPKR